jgi:DNA-binding CsgD family transcriptional regulator
MVAHWAAAVLFNGLGRHEEAAAAAGEVVTTSILPWLAMWARSELVEAAAITGDTQAARDVLEALVASTRPAASCLARGVEARGRALLADGGNAEPRYREAIEQLERSGNRTELARAQLLLGEWLSREGRLREARERLRAAEALFADIGMQAFAERAWRALVAAGAKPGKRLLETSDDLTPQEEQIARLARDGLTNSEIGGQLFLSPRTVEWHLHKVFAKVGISSRNGLGTALPPPEREDTRV